MGILALLFIDFCLDVYKRQPFKRDIVKELADECHKQGIGIHFYYSHIDWWREDAPWGRTGRGLSLIHIFRAASGWHHLPAEI